MIKLDENKIRKGKPVGLPYVGSKKKISKKIVEIIKQNFGTDKTVYDVFGGGGSITAELMINDIDVVYNDLDKTITDIFNRVLHQDREWVTKLIVNRKEFADILKKDKKDVDDEIKLLVNSFGNGKKQYLYSKEKGDMKYELGVNIIKNHNVFCGYKQTKTYKESSYGSGKTDQLEQLQRVQQIERLQEIKSFSKKPDRNNKQRLPLLFERER